MPAVTIRTQEKDVEIGTADHERRSTAAFFFRSTKTSFDVFGQFEVTYGRPVWKAEFGEAIEQAKSGTRFRLGNNFFATLDTSCRVDVGGATLKPGLYYLALKRRGAEQMSLVFLDPVEIRRKKLNASQSADIEGGVETRMTWRKKKNVTEKLNVT